MALQHLRSGTANKRPIPTAMSDGQLAVNTNLASPGLFFKDSNGDLVKAGPVHVGTTAPNASPASTAATALVSGTVYQILTIGTSDFTAVGASANTVGIVFTATGTTTGTGTVSGQQGVEKGEQWLDTTNSLYVMKVYDGTAWRVTDSISLANGSAAAPSLHFGSDTNTGLFRSAADELAVSTAGTQRVVVNASGNIGIGSSNPGDYYPQSNDLVVGTTSGNRGISVVSATTGTGSLVFADGTGNFENRRGQIVYDHSTDSLELFTDQTERLRIDGSGRLLVGTTTEGAVNADNLTINDSGDAGITIRSGSTNAGSLFFSDSTTGAAEYAGYLQYDQSSNYLAIGTNSNERLRIDSSGNVGIGTASPGVRLHAETTAQTALRLRTTGSTTSNPSIQILDPTGAKDGLFTYTSDGIAVGSYTAHPLIFTTQNNERARIDSSGNVGVGTSSPQGKLHLAGSSAALYFEDTASSNTLSRIYKSGSSLLINSRHTSAGQIVFNSENASGTVSERMRIDSSGKVGIGVTAPLVKLDVVDSAAMSAIFRQSSGNQTSVYIEHDDSSGRIGTSYAAGGGAYKPLAFETSNTERMRIDSSGNVGIGTSSPATKLAVQSGSLANGSILVGANYNGSGMANNSDKLGAISFPMYASDTYPKGFRGVMSYASSTLNLVQIGGGTNSARSATDVIFYTATSVSANGSERMRIDSSGNVGIGTASPLAKLHIGGATEGIRFGVSGATPKGDVKYTSSGAEFLDLSIQGTTTGYGNIRFFTGPTPDERMRIDSSGRLLLGTTTEGAAIADNLTVADSGHSGITIRSGTSSFGSLYFSDGTSGAAEYAGFVEYNHNGNYLGFGTGSSSRLRIDSSGNVGIGTTTPTDKLHVHEASSNANFLRITNDTTGSTGGDGVIVGLDSSEQFYIYSYENNHLIFGNNNTERVRIDNSGRLLVGSSSTRAVGYGDNASLQLEGTSYPKAAISSILNSNNANGPSINFAKSRGTSNGTSTVVQNNDILGLIGFCGGDGTDIKTMGARIQASVDGTPGANDMPGRLMFSTTADGSSSPTERMRIDSSGNVGIGNSSPTNSVGFNTLTIGNGTSLGGQLHLENSTGQNFFLWHDANGTNIYNQNSTSQIFYTNGAERMRIDSSGRLLVGTSTTRNYTSLGNPQLQLEGNDYPTASFGLTNNLNGTDGAYIALNKTRGGSAGSQTVVQANDKLGSFWFQGADGTKGVTGATIDAFVDGTPGVNDMPGRLVFSTSADGAASPTARMAIYNNGVSGVFATNADNFFLDNSAAAGTTYAFLLGRYGATSLGSGTVSFRVWNNGNVVNTNNSYGALSDIKLKENIVNASSQWDDLKAIQVRNYNFKEGQTHTQIGVVAQEVELVSPGLVSESPDRDTEGNDLGTTTKSVNYSVLYMKAVKALQEAMERIETLEQRLSDAGIA